MPETYPADSELLALSQDDATGVEYIPTGQSPYATAYRRMLYRLLRAAERANDLRVYPVGGRLVGVRAGRCFVGDQPREVPAPSPIELNPDATTHVYVNEAGTVTTSTAGPPTDRATFIPLAQVVTDGDSITQLTDLRGEAILQAQTAALAGITASTDEINQALAGIDAGVTAAALSQLTGGSQTTADSQHRHTDTSQSVDGPATITFSNQSADSAATIGVDFALPLAMPDVTRLGVDRATGYLTQSHLGQAYHLLGTSTIQWTHSGALSSTITGRLIGSAPISGEVVGLALSVSLNTQSSDPADGLSLTASVNGSTLTTSPATLTAADGAGFRCTDQGDGSAAALATNGTQDVSRGDLITLDLTYTASGTVTQQPTDTAVLAVIKPDRPA
ncbi:MAG: hypothetical protein AAGI37_03030 [Planctomycetota bacterium]